MLPAVEPVVLERPSDGVAALRINRPQVRGALDRQTLGLLLGHLAELAQDPSLAALVFSSTDPTALCAGRMWARCSITLGASPGCRSSQISMRRWRRSRR